MTPTATPPGTIAFLFPAFPNLHQTFVLWEVLALRQRGIDIALYSIKRPVTDTQQPEGAALQGEVTYLPSPLSPAVLAVNLSLLLRAPGRYLGACAGLLRGWWDDRAAGREWRSARISDAAPDRELTAVEYLRGRFNRSPLLYLLKSFWLLPTAVWLGRDLQARGIRRLHAHWASYSATTALIVHWLYDIPFSFTAHAYDIYLVPRLLGVKVREAEFAVTCANINASLLRALGGQAAADHVVVNYHGVSLERFRPRPAAPRDGMPCIVTCGRLEPYKGHHILLRAVAALSRPVRCVLIGEGPQRRRLEQLAQELGIAERVEFTGPLPQSRLAEVYASADLFCLASVVLERSGKRDVIPNVLAEAMAMQMPVVSTDVSGISELVTDRVSGRLVPPNDPAALAAVLDELLNDEPQRRRLAHGALERVQAIFNREVNIEELARLFRGGAPARGAAGTAIGGSRSGGGAGGQLKISNSVRDTLGIFGTRLVWSAMGVVSGVILARWLGPYNRGILALVLLVPSTVLTLTKLGVSQATVYYINRKEASVHQVASNSVILALSLGVLSALIVWLLRDNLLSSVLKDIPTWALAFALARVPLLLLDNYLYSVLQATGQFGVYNTRLLISEALRLVLVAIFVMWMNMGLFAAVITYTLVSVVNMGWLMFTMSRTIHFSFRVDPSLMYNMLSFGVRSYMQVVIAHLLLRIDVYMVQSMLGTVETAYYSLALHFTETVLEVPQAIGLVLYPRLASLPEEEIHRLTAQTCRRTLMVTIPAALVLGLLGPYVITLWYGQAFSRAGAPLPWAAVGVAMMAIFVIITRNFTARGKQRVNTAAGVLALVANVSLNLYLIPRYGIVGASFATAVSYTGACVLLIHFFCVESGMSWAHVLVPKREDIRYFVAIAQRGLANATARFA